MNETEMRKLMAAFEFLYDHGYKNLKPNIEMLAFILKVPVEHRWYSQELIGEVEAALENLDEVAAGTSVLFPPIDKGYCYDDFDNLRH